MSTKEGRRWERNWEFRIDTYILLNIKQITNKDVVYSTGKYTQYFVKKESRIYMYMNHFAIHVKLIQHCKSMTGSTEKIKSHLLSDCHDIPTEI